MHDNFSFYSKQAFKDLDVRPKHALHRAAHLNCYEKQEGTVDARVFNRKHWEELVPGLGTLFFWGVPHLLKFLHIE